MSTRGESSTTAAVGGGRRRARPRALLVSALAATLAVGLVTLTVAPAATADGMDGSTTTTSSTTTSDTPTATPAATDGADATTASTPTASPAPGTTQADLQPAPTPSGAPSSSPTPPPSTGGPAVDPTIADPGDLTSATGRFTGTATPGHRVRVIDPGLPSASTCTAIAGTDGAWSCSGRVRTGPHQVFTVQDVTDASRRTADAPAADVVVPPVVTTRGPTSGTVAGSGDVGTTVTVALSGSTAERTATVGSDGRWVVSWSTGAAPYPNGTVTMTATATASTAAGFRSDLRSTASAPATVTFDRDAPAPPVVTSPRSDQRITAGDLVVGGTGEPRATLTVYVDRAPVCGTTVGADGSWACTVPARSLPAGSHGLMALQHDDAGNHSSPSASVPVVVSAGAGTPGAGPTSGQPSSGSSTGAGGHAPAGGNGTGTPGPTGSGATGSGTPGSDGGGSDGGTGAAAGPDGAGSGRDWSGAAGDWSVATSFDRTVPTIQSAASWSTLVFAAAAAIGFLLLVAGPARLVARTLRGRVALRLWSFTGRNRPRSERRRGDDALPGWASVAIAVTLAAVLTLLGVGVALEARYVRLAIAVLAGTTVLTAVVVLVTRWAAGADRHLVAFRVSPWLVLTALVACGITRAADLSPALVLGVLLVPVGRTDVDTGAMRLGAGIAACARNATARSTALLVLAAMGWVLHSVTTGSGFWTAIVSEFAITLCVGGLGSLVATLLPLAGSAGSALWAHSRARYASIAAVGVALAAAVYSGPAGTHVSPVALALIACACVAAALGTWLWVRVADADAADAQA
ncbi:Ig-like domain-containing protein [Curtobacterium sp. MCBA15_001]|uniref:Ig-like domain-containing protein n=1 Tax=Curtobacterium sp. MCBA15_001 TaxID=1898731 RepID=UPI0008DC7C61|nr:Ig-like domain-containing protein [Curtobacterium sp. MCBA15_001]OIH94108.1 hypothetical protein BIU90_06250 [Curtobacterium sp. MCBA15_001]